MGSLTSPTISAVSGGLATIVGATLIGLTVPAFARYQARSASGADAADEPDTTGTIR